MRKIIYKLTAGLMCATLVLGGTGIYAKADSSSLSLITKFLDEAKLKGRENVYVVTDGEGKTLNVMSSSNSEKAQKVDNKEGLPINVKATYKLDGQDIKAGDIEGKSGKLVIRYDFENTNETSIKVDGKEEKVHVPYTVVGALVVNNKEYSDIKISNGKTVSDGDNLLITAVAYPSLASDLRIEDSELKIYDYIEIEANIKNAKWTNTYFVVTNTVFSAIGSNLDQPTEDNSLSSLLSGMEQLTEGSEKLYDGLDLLDDNTDKLKKGMSALNSGLATLNKNSSVLNKGADQVFASILGTANAQIAQSGATLPTLTKDNYSMILDGAIKKMTAAGDKANVAALTALKGQLDSFNAFYQGVYSYTAGVDSVYNGSMKINGSMPALQSGVDELKKGAGALNGGIEELNDKTVGKLSDDGDKLSAVSRLKELAKTTADEKEYICYIYKMKKN